MLDGDFLNKFIESQTQNHYKVLAEPKKYLPDYFQYWNQWAGISNGVSDIWKRKIEAEEEGEDYFW